MRPATGIILPSLPNDKALDSSVVSIELYLIEPSEKVYLNRSTERMGMQNVLVNKRWGEGAAGAERVRQLLEEERFVEHNSPLHTGPPETAEDDLSR
jgi:hypothetical protein